MEEKWMSLIINHHRTMPIGHSSGYFSSFSWCYLVNGCRTSISASQIWSSRPFNYRLSVLFGFLVNISLVPSAKIMSKLDKVFLMQTSQTSLDWRLIRQAILIYDSYMTESSLCVYLVNAAGSSFYTFLCDIICNISFDRPSSPINSNVGSQAH